MDKVFFLKNEAHRCREAATVAASVNERRGLAVLAEHYEWQAALAKRDMRPT